jgi:hypothetical protein
VFNYTYDTCISSFARDWLAELYPDGYVVVYLAVLCQLLDTYHRVMNNYDLQVAGNTEKPFSLKDLLERISKNKNDLGFDRWTCEVRLRGFAK